ncbi:MAG TPA: Mur ligase family protein [Rhodothermales bacterium]
MTLLYALAVVATLFAGWRNWRRLRYFLHVFQLEGYKPGEFSGWLISRFGAVGLRLSHTSSAIVLIAAFLLAASGRAWAGAVLALALWPILFASSRIYRSDRQKKPLRYTPRLVRLLTFAAAFSFICIVAGLFAGTSVGGPEGFLWFLGGLWVADFAAPLWVLFAAFAMKPVESAVQEGFKEAARARLAARAHLTVLGITGSYGKTSVKFIVAEILRQRYSVLATPGSYNTPMGICLVVNEKLKAEHQVLVLEMGMRHEGDIRELCEIAQPDIAVITSVGVAHLETMGSIDRIAREKGSLLEFSKPGAPAVLNIDDERVAAMADRATGRIWRVSTEGRDAEITAGEIHYDASGATFTVTDESGDTATFHTHLLGRHNVGNILLGIAVGRILGLRLRQMTRAVERIEPVEHRLQLRKEGEVNVIDDAFNSNPVGARNAVEILGQFNGGRRIIITPGMVELGERQAEENRIFGTHIAANADLAILVGDRQTAPIQEGLRSAGFPEERVKVVPSLFAAREFLRSYVRPGDTVLYENDLPDQYNEA